MNSRKLIEVQQKYLIKFLFGSSGKYLKIPEQIVELILSFLFSSPFRQKNMFILKQGLVTLNFTNQTIIHQLKNNFVLTDQLQQLFAVNRPFKIKENDFFMITNKFHQNQRIKVSKIWVKPPTRTQKKILTYCDKFKQFLLGKHHQSKIIDLRYLNRDFLIPEFEKDQFCRDFKNIQENSASFCSFQVLDSYMNLLTRNYIQLSIQSNDLNSSQTLIHKVILDEREEQFLPSVRIQFQQKQKQWIFSGENIMIWMQQNNFTRKKELVRTTDGKVELIQGSCVRNVQDLGCQVL